MKRLTIIMLVLLFGAAGSSLAATKAKYRAFTPTGAGKSAFAKSGDKQYKYFIVDKGTSFGFDVTGPATVKIRTRAAFKPAVKSLDYEIQIWEAERLVSGRKVKASPATILIDNQNVGLSRTVFVKVPKGRHSYRLWLSSAQADKYFARFYIAKQAPKKSKYSSFKPTQFSREVTLVSGTKELPYYLVDGTGGVSVSINGPTELKIYCRANYDQTMKGRSKFTLGMYEAGKEAAQFAGGVAMANKLQFKELKDMIPSTLNVYTFKVPDGRHIYEFKKVEATSPNLALRFKISKVGLGMIP